MTQPTEYYVLYSNTSRYGTAGLRPQVIERAVSADDIRTMAEWEMRCSGQTFEELADIEWIEEADGNLRPACILSPADVLALSIQKLGDDGRLFMIFPTDTTGAAAFISHAEEYCRGDEARTIAGLSK